MNVFDLMGRRALVSRGAARTVVTAIISQPGDPSSTLRLDFGGVEALSPSFVDELISQLSAPGVVAVERLLVIRPPSRLSEKFRAIARGHDVSIEELPDHDWQIGFPLAKTGETG